MPDAPINDYAPPINKPEPIQQPVIVVEPKKESS